MSNIFTETLDSRNGQRHVTGGLGFTYERNKNNLRQKCSFSTRGTNIVASRQCATLLHFYTIAKQVLILLLIWLNPTFISSVQMRPSVGFFNKGLSI